jgi:hypothetical protein
LVQQEIGQNPLKHGGEKEGFGQKGEMKEMHSFPAGGGIVRIISSFLSIL